jgi:hypothetical protein
MALTKTVGTGSTYYIGKHPGAGLNETEIENLKDLAEGVSTLVANQAASTAGTNALLVADFNSLLDKLKAAGLMVAD